MNDRGRFLTTVVYLLVVVQLVGATLTPPDPMSQVIVVVPLGILAVVASAWLVYRDGYGRVPVAVPDPAPYFVEVLGAYLLGGVAGLPFSADGVSLGGIVASPRATVILSVFFATLVWLYALGGHERLAAAGGFLRERASVR